ncbi:hypothetical protein ACOSQ2_026043 [Xanthoceras sorbifolium]
MKKPKSSSKDDAVHTTPTSSASSFTCRQTQQGRRSRCYLKGSAQFGFCDTGVVSGTESDKDSLWAVQESFFSFNRGDSNKDSSAASSNLSRPRGGGNDGNLSSGKPGSSGKKKEVANKIGFLDGVVGDNGSNFDTMSIGSGGQSREQSPNVQGRSRLQTGEPSSSEAGRCESPLGRTGGLRSSDVCTPETSYDCENPKESESPRFQAILCLTSAPRKRVAMLSARFRAKARRPCLDQPKMINRASSTDWWRRRSCCNEKYNNQGKFCHICCM